jgi:hypothetical protein
VDYAAIAEVSGWSPVIGPEAINCQPPDTGNMELLHMFGTEIDQAGTKAAQSEIDAMHRRSIARQELRCERPFAG